MYANAGLDIFPQTTSLLSNYCHNFVFYSENTYQHNTTHITVLFITTTRHHTSYNTIAIWIKNNLCILFMTYIHYQEVNCYSILKSDSYKNIFIRRIQKSREYVICCTVDARYASFSSGEFQNTRGIPRR